MPGLGRGVAALLAAAGLPAVAQAQRVTENVVAQAEDAFGAQIGNERIGLYTSSEVRGFSPVTANNIRIEGIYIDRPGSFTDRLSNSNSVRVGLTAQNYLFPAPTGIVDYQLRPAGDKQIVSVLLGYGVFGGSRLEIDGQFPLIEDKLSVAAGYGLFHDELAHGGDGNVWGAALAPRWRPRPGIEIRPFFGKAHYKHRNVAPLYQTEGDFLPPKVNQRHFIGPEWAGQDYMNTNYGVLGTAALGDWEIAGGLFRSISDIRRSYAHLLTDVRPDGTARRLISADPGQLTTSTSGELRLSRSMVEGDRRHSLHVSLRGRDRAADYGGGVRVDFGRAGIEDDVVDIPRPDYRFGPLSHQRIKQATGAIGYDLGWRGVGTLSLGLQRTDYRKRVLTPANPETRVHDPAWLYNGNVTLDVTRDLVVYGGYTRGLEESGVAPDGTANRTQVMPAILTSQVDAGIRWRVAGDIRLVAGLFKVSKPYFAADENNIFAELGTVAQRGVELSLAGTVLPGLAVVGGAVLTDPRVTGEPVDQGRIGRKPVGNAGRLLTFNANYSLPWVDGVSLTFNTAYHGPRIADRMNRLKTPSAAVVDLGVRYRFRIGRTPALLRFQVNNVTNVFDWKVSGASTFEVTAPRAALLYLTMDL